jgi:hypothetical protein
MVDWLQPTAGDDMERLGREAEPRAFNPLLVAKVLAWLGVAVFVLGTGAVVYLVSRTHRPAAQDGFFFGYSTEGKIYAVVEMMPMVIVAAALLWGVAAFLWSRAPRPE